MSKHYIINFKSEISPNCHQFSVTYSSKFKSLTIDMSDTLGIKCSGKITSPLMDLRKQKTVIISQNAMVVLPLKWQYMFADTSTLSPFPACRISKVSHLCLFFFPLYLSLLVQAGNVSASIPFNKTFWVFMYVTGICVVTQETHPQIFPM